MPPLALLELPAGGLPAAKRPDELLGGPGWPAFGQADPVDARLPRLGRLRLAKLHLAERHAAEQLKRVGTGPKVVPDLNRHLAVPARDHLVGPHGGVPLPVLGLDDGDLSHHLFIDEATVPAWLGRGRWLARGEQHHRRNDEQHGKHQRQHSAGAEHHAGIVGITGVFSTEINGQATFVPLTPGLPLR